MNRSHFRQNESDEVSMTPLVCDRAQSWHVEDTGSLLLLEPKKNDQSVVSLSRHVNKP